MKNIFDLGYSGIKNAETLKRVAEKLEAVVVDVRFSPRSRNPQWVGSTLAKVLGARYLHLGALGNKNYQGGPIEYVDLAGGVREVLALAERQAVIIMCACSNRQECHRLGIVAEIERQTGAVSSPLDAQACTALATDDVQPALF